MMPRTVFNPLLPATRDGGVDIRNVRCPCGGIMFDMTIGLAHWMGVKQYECDVCHDRRAVTLPKEKTHA